mmetsp:Transcript_29934/g.99167  ORF Transcript_29934/g.99167 Transcript_29934/m.99167 type:complete len:560 (-) Transcript_29934:211-1890(-)
MASWSPAAGFLPGGACAASLASLRSNQSLTLTAMLCPSGASRPPEAPSLAASSRRRSAACSPHKRTTSCCSPQVTAAGWSQQLHGPSRPRQRIARTWPLQSRGLLASMTHAVHHQPEPKASPQAAQDTKKAACESMPLQCVQRWRQAPAKAMGSSTSAQRKPAPRNHFWASSAPQGRRRRGRMECAQAQARPTSTSPFTVDVVRVASKDLSCNTLEIRRSAAVFPRAEPRELKNEIHSRSSMRPLPSKSHNLKMLRAAASVQHLPSPTNVADLLAKSRKPSHSTKPSASTSQVPNISLEACSSQANVAIACFHMLPASPSRCSRLGCRRPWAKGVSPSISSQCWRHRQGCILRSRIHCCKRRRNTVLSPSASQQAPPTFSSSSVERRTLPKTKTTFSLEFLRLVSAIAASWFVFSSSAMALVNIPAATSSTPSGPSSMAANCKVPLASRHSVILIFGPMMSPATCGCVCVCPSGGRLARTRGSIQDRATSGPPGRSFSKQALSSSAASSRPIGAPPPIEMQVGRRSSVTTCTPKGNRRGESQASGKAWEDTFQILHSSD